MNTLNEYLNKCDKFFFNVYQQSQLLHRGQTRRDDITPYFDHPYTVAKSVLQYCFYNSIAEDHVPLLVSISLAHDTIEDTDFNFTDWRNFLSEGLSSSQLDIFCEALERLTKEDGVDYYDYLSGVKSNYFASIVKIQDIYANLNDHPSKKQIKKANRKIRQSPEVLERYLMIQLPSEKEVK